MGAIRAVSAARSHRRATAAVLLATFAWLAAAAAEEAFAAPAPHCCMQMQSHAGGAGAPCDSSRACLSAFDDCSCADPPLARSAASERPSAPAQGVALPSAQPAPRPRATPPARAEASALAARHLAHSTVVLRL
jgi:hypothetical protein